MKVMINHWLCLPCHTLPRLSELCRPLHHLAGADNLLGIQTLRVGAAPPTGRKGQVLSTGTAGLSCTSIASLAPGSNPQVPLRPLLVRWIGHLWVSCPYQHRLLASQRSSPVGGLISILSKLGTSKG